MADKKFHGPPIPVRIAVLLLLLGGGFWWWWSSNAAENPADDAATTLSGSLEAVEYQVSPAIAGRVVELNVAEGDKVAVSDVLVKLDDTTLALQVEQAKQAVTVAKANQTNVKNDKDKTKADRTAAAAKVAQAEAAVKLAEAQLSYATITAPQAGTVTSVTTNVGQNAAPAKTLLTIVETDHLFARVYVSETEIGNVLVGQGAQATTDSSQQTFAGKVTFIASQAQFTPNTIQTKEQRVKLVYEVRVELDDPSGTLKPGMPVDVTLATS
ncbi:MAG: efflux RND transporter periplasmic adaptor subunit [Propionibacteriaceae bacterium]|jgi:HlyD family secretion protein|nr:efflux RND transporter periplasmic adaptor subunit [Propionibacteriaceae bacterium]